MKKPVTYRYKDITRVTFYPEGNEVMVDDLSGDLNVLPGEWVSHAKAANLCGQLKRMGYVRV